LSPGNDKSVHYRRFRQDSASFVSIPHFTKRLGKKNQKYGRPIFRPQFASGDNTLGVSK
jgi:hypothetical protein